MRPLCLRFSVIVFAHSVALLALLACGGSTAPTNCSSDSDCTAGYRCIGGECGLPPAAPCAGSQTSCGGTCSDAASDPKNCGSCGHTCAAGLTCASGACQPPCAVGLTSCGSGCIDESS